MTTRLLSMLVLVAGCAVGGDGFPDRRTIERAPLTAAVWQTNGVFVWHANAFPAGAYAERMRAGGFAWVAVQIHDGLTPMAENEGELARGWADPWRAAGFRVGCWGVQRLDPEGEARVANELLRRYAC